MTQCYTGLSEKEVQSQNIIEQYLCNHNNVNFLYSILSQFTDKAQKTWLRQLSVSIIILRISGAQRNLGYDKVMMLMSSASKEAFTDGFRIWWMKNSVLKVSFITTNETNAETNVNKKENTQVCTYVHICIEQGLYIN